MNFRKLLLFILPGFFLPLLSLAQWTSSFNGSSSPRAVLQFTAVDENVIWAVLGDPFFQQPVKEFTKSNNGGLQWTQGTVNITGDYQLNALFALDQEKAWAVMEADTGGGCVVFTSDGGISWTIQDSAVFQKSPKWIHFWNDTSGLAIGDPVDNRFEIFVTNDGGTDWEKVNYMDIPVSQPGEFTLTNSFDVIGDTVLFGGSTLGKIFLSPDKGKHWSFLPSPLNDIKKVLFFDSLCGIIGSPSIANLKWNLYETTNGGLHWSAFENEGPLYFADICKAPGAKDILISVGTGLSYSNDQGKTWTNFENPPVDPSPYYNTVLFSDFAHGWAGGVNPQAGVGGISRYSGPALDIPGFQKPAHIILLYPNPSDGHFTLTTEGLSQQTCQLRIMDLAGRIIRQEIIDTGLSPFSKSFDLSGTTPGFYLIQLVSSTGVLQKELILR